VRDLSKKCFVGAGFKPAPAQIYPDFPIIQTERIPVMNPYRRILQIFFLGFSVVSTVFSTGCLTTEFTTYRNCLLPASEEFTRCSFCTFKGPVEINSREYLQYYVYDHVRWGKKCRIAYSIPKEGDGPAFARKNTDWNDRKSDIEVLLCFYFEPDDSTGKNSRPDFDSKVKKAESLIKKPNQGSDHPSSQLRPMDSVLFICATRTGKGTQISLLTKKDSQWVESGPYVVEQPVYEGSWLINTWNILSCAGYGVTVPVDTVTTIICFPFLCMMADLMSPR